MANVTIIPPKAYFNKKLVNFVQGLDGWYHAVTPCKFGKGSALALPLTVRQTDTLTNSPRIDLVELFPMERSQNIEMSPDNVTELLKDPDFRAQLLFGCGQTPGEIYWLSKEEEPSVELLNDYGYFNDLSFIERVDKSKDKTSLEYGPNSHTIVGSKLIAFEPVSRDSFIAKCFCNAHECEVHVLVDFDQMLDLCSMQSKETRIQDILPTTDTELREIFLSGLTPAEFDAFFSNRLKSKEEYLHLGYQFGKEGPSFGSSHENEQSPDHDHDHDHDRGR